MIRIAAETPWYDLFSRGARDWLRHNQKVREAVKNTLPEILSGEDLMTGSGKNRTVMVPVKFLEHSRFRLADPSSQQGAGQGRGQPGDGLQPGRDIRAERSHALAGELQRRHRARGHHLHERRTARCERARVRLNPCPCRRSADSRDNDTPLTAA